MKSVWKIGFGKCYRILLALAVLATGIGLVRYTDSSMEIAGKAAAMCLEVILPSLFPFLVFSNLVIGMGYAEMLGQWAAPLMRRVFRVDGACAGVYLMGIIGGYPVGARAAIQTYEQGLCSKTECQRMLSFCNNSGPAFILGVVGTGIFSSSRAGLMLYLVHILASLTVGVCFRFYRSDELPGKARTLPRKEVRPAAVFVDAVRNGLSGIGSISAFVIFFAVAVNLLFASGLLSRLSHGIAQLLSPVGITEAAARRLLTGIVEITSGLSSLRDAAESLNARLSMAAFLLGWAGISVHCQVLSFLGNSGISLLPYLCGKALHSIVSAFYMTVLCKIILPDYNTASVAVGQIGNLVLSRSPSVSSAWVLCCITLIGSYILLKIQEKI